MRLGDRLDLARGHRAGLLDRDMLFDRAVDYFWNGEGNGAVDCAIPFVYDNGFAQWQESGRDHYGATSGGFDELGFGTLCYVR